MSSPGFTDPEEVNVTIDPLNPLRVAAGANIDYRYWSLDGGLTWFESFLSSSLGVAGDPIVLYDDGGHLFYAHLSSPPFGSWLDRIVVQRSTDGGASWNDGAGVGLNPPKDQDKPWLAADLTASPYHGRVYLGWTEFDAYGSAAVSCSTRILFSRSADHGLSWSPPLRVNEACGNCIDSDNTVEGATPAVGANGEVYLSWSGPGGIRFDRSFDGGATFGADVFVAAQPGGWDFDVPGIYRTNGLPMTLCDTGTSPYRGRIYIVWADQRAGTTNTDVFVARSTDGGATWAAPVRVNPDIGTTHQFFPGAALDPTTGIVYVVYYDRSTTVGNATHVFLARSADGGQTFSSVRLSETTFTPDPGVFFGDYIGVAALNRKVRGIWMRMDGSALSIWTAQWSDTGAVVGAPEPSRPGVVALALRAAPNPFRASTRVSWSLAQAGDVSVRILDVQGRLVETLVEGAQPAGRHEVAWDARGRATGLYFVAVASGGVRRTEKLILVR